MSKYYLSSGRSDSTATYQFQCERCEFWHQHIIDTGQGIYCDECYGLEYDLYMDITAL